MTYTAVDVHGFGGGFTLATVQAGFELIGKMSAEAGFGVHSTLQNRHLLGHGWDSITGGLKAWDTDLRPDFVFGNPPCSGFSTLSPKAFRGMDSSINSMMWDVVNYAGRVAPKIVAWESVQQTFRQGLPLMRQLHDKLEEVSGLRYTLHHVLHNNASVGGASIRKRYFWVAVQEGIPFGVDPVQVSPDGTMHDPVAPPTFRDILHDLDNLGLGMERQRYRGVGIKHGVHSEDEPCTEACIQTVLNSSDWCRREMHDPSAYVDGHQVAHSPTLNRIQELLQMEEWNEGERMSDVMRRHYHRTGDIKMRTYNYLTNAKTPDGQNVHDEEGNLVRVPKLQRLIETDFAMGFNQPVRWRSDRPANVITGGAVHLIVHPYLPRTLTQREAARIQGFPDAWRIWPLRSFSDLGPAWGKGVPVQAGRWIARWCRAALDGTPGSDSGIPLESYNKKLSKAFGPREREYIVDITNDWKAYGLTSSAAA